MKSTSYKGNLRNYSTLYNYNNSKKERKKITDEIVKNTINSLEDSVSSLYKNLNLILSNVNYKKRFVNEFELMIDKISTMVLFEIFHYLKTKKSEDYFKVILKNKYMARVKRVGNKIFLIEENILKKLYCLVETELYIRLSNLKFYREKIIRENESIYNINEIKESNLNEISFCNLVDVNLLKIDFVSENNQEEYLGNIYDLSLVLYDKEWNYIESYFNKSLKNNFLNYLKRDSYFIDLEYNFIEDAKYLFFSVKGINNNNLSINLEIYKNKESFKYSNLILNGEMEVPFIIDLEKKKLFIADFDVKSKKEFIKNIINFNIVKKVKLHEIFFIHSLLGFDKIM